MLSYRSRTRAARRRPGERLFGFEVEDNRKIGRRVADNQPTQAVENVAASARPAP